MTLYVYTTWYYPIQTLWVYIHVVYTLVYTILHTITMNHISYTYYTSYTAYTTHSIHTSSVSLNGAVSKLRYPPGAIDNINPKSICNICPSLSIKIFPLWRSFIYNIYVNNEYAASDAAKFFLACIICILFLPYIWLKYVGKFIKPLVFLRASRDIVLVSTCTIPV